MAGDSHKRNESANEHRTQGVVKGGKLREDERLSRVGSRGIHGEWREPQASSLGTLIRSPSELAPLQPEPAALTMTNAAFALAAHALLTRASGQ